MGSIASPLQLIATAELSANSAFYASESFVTPALDYLALEIITNLGNVLASMPAANVPASTINNLSDLTASNFPALTDSVPSTYSTLLENLWGNNWNTTIGFMGGMVLDFAERELGEGDAAVFSQIFSAAVGYVQTTNQYINSVKNSQEYLGSTFTSMNSLTTGNLTDVNAATRAFGEDLAKLGNLINLNNLDNLGSPLALLQQLGTITGLIPSIRTALIQVGIDANVAETFTNSTTTVTDDINKLIYTAMTNIKGDDLSQILQIFGVTTSGISSMADLLNPKKIFPNSYQTLTVKTDNGLRGIYASDGSVNTNLEQYLPDYVLSVEA